MRFKVGTSLIHECQIALSNIHSTSVPAFDHLLPSIICARVKILCTLHYGSKLSPTTRDRHIGGSPQLLRVWKSITLIKVPTLHPPQKKVRTKKPAAQIKIQDSMGN